MWDSLLSLREAWHWVQIGFCVALGAVIIFAPIAGAASGTRVEPAEDPHCSRCCPNADDDVD